MARNRTRELRKRRVRTDWSVLHRSGFDVFMYVASRVVRWKAVDPWARIEKFLLLYSCPHNGFCKRCKIAEYDASGALLFNWLERERYLRSRGVCSCEMYLAHVV